MVVLTYTKPAFAVAQLSLQKDTFRLIQKLIFDKKTKPLYPVAMRKHVTGLS